MSPRDSRNRRLGYQPRSEDETRFCRAFDAIFDRVAGESPSGRDYVTATDAVRRFFEAIEGKGDGGYRLAGILLRETLEDFPPPHETASRVLTAFARQYVGDNPERHYIDLDGEPRAAFPESRVHHVGRLISALDPESSERVTAALVAWCEDMESGLPARASDPPMLRQETAVIRGALLSTSVDQARMVRFWKAAAASPCFPWRVFSDPCRSERGVIFASTHLMSVSRILSVTDDATARRIATHIATHATYRRREVRPGGVIMPYDEAEPATAEERRAVLKTIVSAVEGEKRRELVDECFTAIPAAS